MEDHGPQDGPDQLGADYAPQRTFKEHISHIVKAFTTKHGVGISEIIIP
jgi:hypothetical protein